MKKRILAAICCVIAIVLLVVVAKLIANDFSTSHYEPSEDYERLKSIIVDPTPTPSFDEQVDALLEKYRASGWDEEPTAYGEFHLSTMTPDEKQEYLTAIIDAATSGD